MRQWRHEAVLSRTGHIAHVRPASVTVVAAAAYHHVGVDIDGINGVGDTNEVVPVQQFLEVARIALRTVVDEYFVDIEVDASRQEIVLEDGLAKEVVALLGTVAPESFSRRHFICSTVHCLDHGGSQRLGDIADAQ